MRGDHLIGGEEEAGRRVQQHRLLQRVSAAGQHRDRAAAERQRLPRLQPAIGGGHAGGDAQVVVAATEHLFGDRVRQAVAAVEPAIVLRAQVARCVLQAEAEQILGAWHQQIEAETFAHPAGEADMVGVVVRDDQPREPGAGERPGEHGLPGRAARLVADPAIEHRPALAIGDQIDVDVIEPERQRQAQPQHAVCDLHRRAEGGRLGVREDQVGVVRRLRHEWDIAARGAEGNRPTPICYHSGAARWVSMWRSTSGMYAMKPFPQHRAGRLRKDGCERNVFFG